MNAEEFKQRTQKFALDVIQFVEGLPNLGAAYIIGRQLVRAGTSVGANYRAACRARSRADFIAKLKVVEEECDEIALLARAIWPDGIQEPTADCGIEEGSGGTPFDGGRLDQDGSYLILQSSIVNLHEGFD